MGKEVLTCFCLGIGSVVLVVGADIGEREDSSRRLRRWRVD